MGKKKKTYVRPEMKIIEVKTEGVIAASSGGEIEIPNVPEEYITELLENCTQGGNYKQIDINTCTEDLTVNYTPCQGTWNKVWALSGREGNPTKGMPVKLCHKLDGTYSVTFYKDK